MTGNPRRKSVDSSDSSNSGSDHKKHKEKKEKKEKHKDKVKVKKGERSHDHQAGDDSMSCQSSKVGHQGHFQQPQESHYAGGGGVPFNRCPEPHQRQHHEQQPFGQDFRGGQTPEGVYRPQTQQAPPPPSGYRLPLDATSSQFPDFSQTGPPPFLDADNVSPIFIGSALLGSSVHPCKIGPHLRPFTSVPYGGGEYGHQGRFDLLPYKADLMEWVRTSGGRIPSGRRPVEGGYEESGEKLYHAVGVVNGVKVPGKTGEHLGGARVAFGGAEQAIDHDYEILCWQ